MHHAQMHESSAFITLTYDDEHLPRRGDLHYPDFKNFCRRTRRRMGPFSFFMSGEYGDESERPHYHACMFGLSFGDRTLYKRSGSGFDLYTSGELSALWPHGHASVGNLTFESAAYVARYVTKKVTGDAAAEHYLRHDEYGEAYWLTPEFSVCSKGIGKSWFLRFGEEVLSRGNVVMNGHEMKPPRYYGKLSKDPRYDWVESQSSDVNPEDCTPARLMVREEVTKARLRFKKRTL